MRPSVAQLRQLVGNPNVYAVQTEEGYYPVREPLTDAVLLKHTQKEVTVGTYIGHPRADGETVARTLVFDFDEGYDTDASLSLIQVKEALTLLGVPLVWGTEDSGRKGYHLWLVLKEYVPSTDLRRLGRAVCALADWHGEVFPKQNQVRDLGNLVKLPGGVHLLTGRENNFMDRIPEALTIDQWAAVLEGLPEEVRATRPATDSRFPCMEAILEEGAPEGARNDQLFHLATMLRRAGLTDEYVELVVRSVNEKTEPLDDFELVNLLKSSMNSGPLCSRLPEDRHCGDLCVLERTSGLYTRPGAMRFAAPGERVVVEVVDHKDSKDVYITHDDTKAGKVVLR